MEQIRSINWDLCIRIHVAYLACGHAFFVGMAIPSLLF